MKDKTTDQPKFPEPETDGAVAALDEQIAAERQVIAQIESEHKRHKRHLATLEDARRVLVRTSRARRVRSGAKQIKTAAQRAGKGNIESVRDLLQHNGPMAKADVTRAMNKNDGTVTYALRALEETGEARRTGERVGGSDVYEYVPRRHRAVTRPGDRR